MKNIGTITIAGQAHQLQEASYENGRVAIVIDEGRWGKLTVNVAAAPPPPAGCIHVKTWEENERLRDAALATGLFQDTGERVPCGLATAEVWRYIRQASGYAGGGSRPTSGASSGAGGGVSAGFGGGAGGVSGLPSGGAWSGGGRQWPGAPAGGAGSQSNDRQATVKQGQFSDQVREAVRDALSAALGQAMDCTRAWSAWQHRTMSEDDFQLLADNDERLDELVDAIETAIAAAPPAPCDQAVYEGGAVVAILDGGKLAVEGLVGEANRRTPGMDWHYFGGRAVVKTLGDVPAARQALERAVPRFLDGPAAPSQPAARAQLATEFDHSEGGHHD